MKTYIWQRPGWPQFHYSLDGLHEAIQGIALKLGKIDGKMAHLDAAAINDALVDVLIEEAIKTSEIEGEYISRPDVMSSIKNKLGLNERKVRIQDKRAQGVVDMMLAARESYREPLTDKMLFEWHLMLMSSSLLPNLEIGTWRTHTEPMQIVSRAHGQWKVHYEAPPSNRVPGEMKAFIDWFNDTMPGRPHSFEFAPVRAAIAHLYFECIHPFEDGNRRIGRAIAEKALSQGYGHPILLSLSKAIELDKKRYYHELNKASYSNEVTSWVHYFIDLIIKAQNDIESQIDFILSKAKFFDEFEQELNERQLKVIRKMMSYGTKGFEGGMTAKKFIQIAGTSKATATRDLQHLTSLGIFKPIGKGRSVRYNLILGEFVI